MYYDGKIYAAKDGSEPLFLLPKKANRHGLIAGATGTGKTITLKVLAESFSDMGVPVFLADVKGDLAGMINPGVDTEDMQKRIEKFNLKEAGFDYRSYPTTFWDIFGQNGLPLRTTISEMGPTLLARLMNLTQTQEDILNIVFQIADREGLLLLDSKDLRSMIMYVADASEEYSREFGNLPKASLNVIQRSVAALEAEGGDMFFGEPAINIKDWIKQSSEGKGMINILDSEILINHPKIYSTFMLSMLSELFEIMPEVGDLDKPRIVFFFDEAHLLFNDAPKALLQKIEQVVKLIRSKGVGIYFITQNPADIPDGVLGQLGNKIQHALRAYTPNEMKGLKAASDSFRANPDFKTVDVLQELGTGEALVSFLQEDGTPSVVRRANILPPQSQMGPISTDARDKEIKSNILYFSYADPIDRDSAYELLEKRYTEAAEAYADEQKRIAEEAAAEKERVANERAEERARIAAEKEAERRKIAAEKEYQRKLIAAEKAAERAAEKAAAAERKSEEAERKKRDRMVNSFIGTTGGTIGRQLGKSFGKTLGGSFGKTLGGNLGANLGRGLLGNLFGKR